MGDAHRMYCQDCREHIWIGQRGAGSTVFHLYGSWEHAFGLNMFLVKHMGHPLTFGIEDIHFNGEQTKHFDLAEMVEKHPETADELLRREEKIQEAYEAALEEAFAEVDWWKEYPSGRRQLSDGEAT